MSTFETIVPTDADAVRLTTAFYRFIEARAYGHDAQAAIHTEMVPQGELRTITLWSDQAIAEFKSFLDGWSQAPC
ncbi:MAG: hypothetical protein JO303_13035 [Caulobacteraceae bacterium]|nr:hypothetical protein [Caulobacteraceae bacterium]